MQVSRIKTVSLLGRYFPSGLLSVQECICDTVGCNKRHTAPCFSLGSLLPLSRLMPSAEQATWMLQVLWDAASCPPQMLPMTGLAVRWSSIISSTQRHHGSAGASKTHGLSACWQPTREDPGIMWKQSLQQCWKTQKWIPMLPIQKQFCLYYYLDHWEDSGDPGTIVHKRNNTLYTSHFTFV